MKIRICIALLGVFLTAAATSWGAPPVVSNIRASQRVGTQLVDIYYNISDPDSTVVTVYLAISADAGTNYNVPAYTFGPGSAIGAGVAVGIDRHIAWNAGSDWTGQFSAQCKVRLIADDGSGPTAPVGMVFIPSGTFQMGDNFGLNSSALPVHPVYVSAFFMEKFEVTKQLWDDVSGWATVNGYDFSNSGSAAGPSHPVTVVRWYDMVKWCNARSEKEGLVPVYYTNDRQTNVYRTGNINLVNSWVRWGANGYRLPTEAEWEKAARGGLSGQQYPWWSPGSNYASYLNGSMANYYLSGDPLEAGTTPVGYYNGGQSPPGTNMMNGYGLYDMAGNVAEWCWDSSYPYPAGMETDPRGPAPNSARVFRGGSSSGSHASAAQLRCAFRNWDAPGGPSYWQEVGFRCARSF